MGFGSDVAIALGRERLQATDVYFSADIAELTYLRSAFSPRRKYVRCTFRAALAGTEHTGLICPDVFRLGNLLVVVKLSVLELLPSCLRDNIPNCR
jgi:hypothetical protein